jgi:hypothetical protein
MHSDSGRAVKRPWPAARHLRHHPQRSHRVRGRLPDPGEVTSRRTHRLGRSEASTPLRRMVMSNAVHVLPPSTVLIMRGGRGNLGKGKFVPDAYTTDSLTTDPQIHRHRQPDRSIAIFNHKGTQRGASIALCHSLIRHCDVLQAIPARLKWARRRCSTDLSEGLSTAVWAPGPDPPSVSVAGGVIARKPAVHGLVDATARHAEPACRSGVSALAG